MQNNVAFGKLEHAVNQKRSAEPKQQNKLNEALTLNESFITERNSTRLYSTRLSKLHETVLIVAPTL